MNLFDDALLQFDELEALFSNVLLEKNMSWFGSFITPGPKDDSTPLLSVTRKSYRDLILANTISVFDFRIYIITRQCLLLAKLGKLDQICRKTHTFLTTFTRRLRDVEVGEASSMSLFTVSLTAVWCQHRAHFLHSS